MTTENRFTLSSVSHRQLLLGVIALVLALCGAYAFGAVAKPATAEGYIGGYKKPKTGNWKVPEYFDYVRGGSMKIKKQGKNGLAVTKLVIKLGSYGKQQCGVGTVRLRKKMKMKRYKKVNNRWAIARNPKGLFIPRNGAKLKVGKKKKKAKMLLIWDHDGKTATSGKLEIKKQCTVQFFARK